MPIILIALILTKLASTVYSIKWIRKYGDQYVARLKRFKTLTGGKIRRVIREISVGDEWILGLLEYRGIDKGGLSELFCKYVLRVTTLGPLSLAIYIICTLILPESAINDGLWMAVALSGQICCCVMIMESIYCFTTIDSFRKYFHVGIRTKKDEQVRDIRPLEELEVLIPMGFACVIFNVLAFQVAAEGFQSFMSKDEPVAHLGLEGLFNSIYFVLATMGTVSFGDIAPGNTIGRMAALLMVLQGVLLIAGTVSILISRSITAKS